MAPELHPGSAPGLTQLPLSPPGTLGEDVEVGGPVDHHTDGLQTRPGGGHLAGVAGVPLHHHVEGRLGDLVANEFDDHLVRSLRDRGVLTAVGQVSVVVELGVNLKIRRCDG